jgi:hypothetical protein
MTWQDAIRSDPEARQDFVAWVSNQIAAGFRSMDAAVDDANPAKLQVAKGKKDAYVELKTAFETEDREAEGYADFRRAAAGR